MTSSRPKSILEGARRIRASLLFGALAVIVFFLPGATELLQYDRAALASGEWWRLVTGHWTHAGGQHLLFDVITFVALGGFLEARSRRAFWFVVGTSILAISLTLVVFNPELDSYRGLSGVDCALYVAVIAYIIRDHGRDRWLSSVAGIMLVAFVGKIVYEWGTGATLFVTTFSEGFAPVPLAHLVGGLAGGLAVLPLSRSLPGFHSRLLPHRG